MDKGRMRHIPLFLETSIHGEIRKGASWLDLRTLMYHRDGTRPGYIHIVSDDGLVSIEVVSRRDKGPAPIFVTYSFPKPVDLRLTGRFKYPDFTRGARVGDANGNVEFDTLWRSANSVLTTTDGPALNI